MSLWETDPEFAERMEAFTLKEVVNEPGQQLEPVDRHLAILAALLGCQGLEEFRLAMERALDEGVSAVMVKEVVYQAVDYLGIGRTRLNAANDILKQRGIALPLPGQATTTWQNRLEQGVRVQTEIFGEGMKEAWKSGHIQRWLAENFIKGLRSDLAVALTRVRNWEHAAEAARRELLKRSIDRKTLEKLKARQAEQYAQDEKHREQKQFDETASLRFKVSHY